MRDFFDEILEFIDSESLTDDEFNSIEVEGSPGVYTKEIYVALKAVLDGREDVSGKTKRLKLMFIAKGIDVSDTLANPVPNSNIFIGSAL